MDILEILFKYHKSFLGALIITAKLSIISLIGATIIGVIFGMFRISKNRLLRGISTTYIELIRGTPLMVQAFIIYYGLAQVLRPFGFSWAPLGGAFTAGVLSLSLNSGAYMAEIIRGGIEAIDIGQIEAARSLGLSYFKTMRKIVLPQAFRIMLPSIINQFIISLKDTSILSIIGIKELTMNGKLIAANSATMVMPIWIVVALFYFCICMLLSSIAKYTERRLSYGK
ncbi:amino acid ABC transporter permease [Fusobacterium mortiferum]|uniref:amino acid ABC transporter permease n=1 Tax=Fusobacterium mortiferum TaxID=850 RepID=UPI000E436BA6|nr:amino acid ABC transporter permease [Fusobacterium mortiferum]RGM99849.1 amino acid ABC transporter permease [Fusobacterium mortiferum]